jgi:hypothetical protein
MRGTEGARRFPEQMKEDGMVMCIAMDSGGILAAEWMFQSLFCLACLQPTLDGGVREDKLGEYMISKPISRDGQVTCRRTRAHVAKHTRLNTSISPFISPSFTLLRPLHFSVLYTSPSFTLLRPLHFSVLYTSPSSTFLQPPFLSDSLRMFEYHESHPGVKQKK